MDKFSVGLKFLHLVSVSGLYVMGKVLRNLIMGLQRASKTAVSSRSQLTLFVTFPANSREKININNIFFKNYNLFQNINIICLYLLLQRQRLLRMKSNCHRPPLRPKDCIGRPISNTYNFTKKNDIFFLFRYNKKVTRKF